MKENSFKEIADQLKGLEEAFKKLPEMMAEQMNKLSEEEKTIAKEFETEAKKIANGGGNFMEKMLKVQELKKQYGERINNK